MRLPTDKGKFVKSGNFLCHHSENSFICIPTTPRRCIEKKNPRNKKKQGYYEDVNSRVVS